jgi:hypothetical protein
MREETFIRVFENSIKEDNLIAELKKLAKEKGVQVLNISERKISSCIEVIIDSKNFLSLPCMNTMIDNLNSAINWLKNK